MNIIDAIKSGKPFYRRSWTNRTMIRFEDVGNLSEEAMVADDWEVKDIPVTINRQNFKDAWERAVNKAGGRAFILGRFESFPDLVARELGL